MLRKDGRMRYAEIARLLKKSPGIIKRRIEIMRDQGIIKEFRVVPDWSKLGYHVHAFVGIVADPARVSAIYNQLKKLGDAIQAIYITSGRFNILLELRARDIGDLRDQLMNRIYNIDGIRHIETFLVLS